MYYFYVYNTTSNVKAAFMYIAYQGESQLKYIIWDKDQKHLLTVQTRK